MPDQARNQGGGFFSGLITALKTFGSITCGLPIALATTISVGLTVAALNVVNFSSILARRMFSGNNSGKDLLIPINNSAAFGVVKSSWNFFLFPYKRLTALITGSSGELHEQFAPSHGQNKVDNLNSTTKNHSKDIDWVDDGNLYNFYNPAVNAVNHPSNHPSAPFEANKISGTEEQRVDGRSND